LSSDKIEKEIIKTPSKVITRMPECRIRKMFNKEKNNVHHCNRKSPRIQFMKLIAMDSIPAKRERNGVYSTTPH
jgi:hypothetical protein